MAQAETKQEPISEAVPEPTQEAERRASNAKNLKKMAALYGSAVVAALALYGAAQTWAAATGLLIASITAIAAAVVAGNVLSGIFHEWGHFSGAALAGSKIKIPETPSDLYFFLGFDVKANSTRQALWLTWGGLSGSWLLVVLVALLIPLGSWGGAILLATVFGRAVNASVFEIPVALRTRKSENFRQELKDQLASPGIVQLPGLIAGSFAALTLIAAN